MGTGGDALREATGGHILLVLVLVLVQDVVEEYKSFEGHKDDILCMSTFPSRSLLATGDYEGRINVWHLNTGEKRYSLYHRSHRYSPSSPHRPLCEKRLALQVVHLHWHVACCTALRLGCAVHLLTHQHCISGATYQPRSLCPGYVTGLEVLLSNIPNEALMATRPPPIHSAVAQLASSPQQSLACHDYFFESIK
jgi:WD40 repeat protein